MPMRAGCQQSGSIEGAIGRRRLSLTLRTMSRGRRHICLLLQQSPLQTSRDDAKFCLKGAANHHAYLPFVTACRLPHLAGEPSNGLRS